MIFIHKNQPVSITRLKEVVEGPNTYIRSVNKLIEAGLVMRTEKISRRKLVLLSLTPEGERQAHALLKQEEELHYEIPADFKDRFKNMSAMVHFNVKDDHVAVTEHNFDGNGNDRVIYIYTRPNGHNVMRLWCDADQTFQCKHSEFAWTLPDVQEMVELRFKEGLKNKGVKIE